jgi:DNA-binding NarL/FixJ family response regulator
MDGARSSAPGCVIVDLDSPELDDLRVLEHLERISLHTPLIFVGSGGETRLRNHALAAAAGAFFGKPIDVERFIVTLLGIPAVAPVPLMLAGLRSHDMTAPPRAADVRERRAEIKLPPPRKPEGPRP